MNWLLILVALVLALNILNGYRRGFLRMVYSMVSWIVIFVFVTWAAPYVNTFLTENTPLYESIVSYCENAVREKTETQLAGETEGEEAAENGAESQDAPEGQTQELADLGVKLPDSVLNSFLEKTTDAAGEALAASGIYERIAAEMAAFILNGIAFLITLAAAIVLSHFISRMLGIVSRIPIIRGVNRYLGTAAGALYGFLLVWIAFYVIALGSASSVGAALVSYIYDSPFLTYLYENNPVVTLALMFL